MNLFGSFAVEYRDTHTLRHSRPYKLLGDAIDREQIDQRKAALNGETTIIVRVLEDGTYAALETDGNFAVDQQINRSATTGIDTIGAAMTSQKETAPTGCVNNRRGLTQNLNERRG